MDKIQEATALSVKFLRTTPTMLRQLAARLETQAREATLPGEVIVYPLTKSLTLVYEPEVSLPRWKRGDSEGSPHALVSNTEAFLTHENEPEAGP